MHLLRKIRGFTLVELLVVMTIIVFLVAMLVPAVEQAASYAREAKCLANLSQVGVAMRMYTNDNRLYYPSKALAGLNSIFNWVGTAGSVSPWDAVGADLRHLNRYVGAASSGPRTPVPIAACPSETPIFPFSVQAGTSYASNHSSVFSSLMARGPSNGNSIRTIDVLNPSRLVAGADDPGLSAGWAGARNYYWHRPSIHAVLFADNRAAMTNIPWGVAVGSDYTFDEQGRE